MPSYKTHRPEYNSWLGMRHRCRTVTHPYYLDYGGRGIKVVDRWYDSFPNFVADMGTRPTPEHTLERIDNNGDYEPGNCKWATPEEQRANKRPVVKGRNPAAKWVKKVRPLIEHNGIKKTRQDWARSIPLDQATFRDRLKRGWSMEDALKPVIGRPPGHL